MLELPRTPSKFRVIRQLCKQIPCIRQRKGRSLARGHRRDSPRPLEFQTIRPCRTYRATTRLVGMGSFGASLHQRARALGKEMQAESGAHIIPLADLNLSESDPILLDPDSL